MLAIEKNAKKRKQYCCEKCDYMTCNKTDYERHCETIKHKNAFLAMEIDVFSMDFSQKTQKEYSCECGKVYKDNSGLWRHRKKCFKKKYDDITPELILELIKDNKELKQIISEQNSTINNLVSKGITNNNQSNIINSMNNNKTFNIQLFLNETCKDAINITDFVNNIKLDLDDLEHTGRTGYIEGITNIIIKNLNSLEQHLRPLHCSDFKREVLYIKDNDEWTKETIDKPILTKAIKNIANENIKQINKWKEQHPGCDKADSKKNTLFLKIVSNSMNGLTKEESDKNIEKIITNVAKEVIINKFSNK